MSKEIDNIVALEEMLNDRKHPLRKLIDRVNKNSHKTSWDLNQNIKLLDIKINSNEISSNKMKEIIFQNGDLSEDDIYKETIYHITVNLERFYRAKEQGDKSLLDKEIDNSKFKELMYESENIFDKQKEYNGFINKLEELEIPSPLGIHKVISRKEILFLKNYIEDKDNSILFLENPRVKVDQLIDTLKSQKMSNDKKRELIKDHFKEHENHSKKEVIEFLEKEGISKSTIYKHYKEKKEQGDVLK